MKTIDDLIPDIQSDVDKIAKSFNSQIAKTFYEELQEKSKDWYYFNKSSGIYKRTKQLRDKAVLKEKIDNYEYKISFSPEKIQPQSWGVYDKETKRRKIGSYTDVKGNNMAASVLQWEEEGVGVFSKYNYQKGGGIWGKTLKSFINKVDNISVNVPKLSLPDDIKKDLIEIMKKELKKQLEKEYKEEYQ